MQAMEGALRQVKTDLALGAITEAEKIEITEKEIDAECERLAEQYGMKADEVKKVVPLTELKKDLSNQKAANIIFDSAKVGKAPAKKDAKKADATAAAEKKPAKKTAAKAEEKKPAAKKTAEKKPAKKAKSEE